jgi:hypothetical protein
VGDRLGACVEGERGHDDVVPGADSEHPQRDGDRVGAVRDTDHLTNAEIGRELPLERLDLGAEDELAGVDHAGDRPVHLLADLTQPGPEVE